MCINRQSFNSLKKVVLMAVGLLMALAVSAQTETIRTVGGKTTYANPPQSPKNNSYKVTKVIRSRESTIVHFYINEHKHSLSSVWTELRDEDTAKRCFRSAFICHPISCLLHTAAPAPACQEKT